MLKLFALGNVYNEDNGKTLSQIKNWPLNISSDKVVYSKKTDILLSQGNKQ